MECCDRVRGGRGQSKGRPRRVHAGVMTCTTRAHHGLRPLTPPDRRPLGGCGRGQAADVAVTQPVEHQLISSRAAATTPMLRPRRSPTRSRICPSRVCAGTRCTASTAAQRTSREPCFVIRPRCTVVSDSWCFGVSPAQRGQLLGPVRSGRCRRSRRRTPRPAPARPRGWPGSRGSRGRCAAGRRPACANRSISKSSAVISRSSESTRDRDSAVSATPASRCLPAGAEQVAHRHLHAGAGEHGVDLALQARAQPDQLRPVPHPAAQLPGRGWGDPRLGQPAHPQQIGQVRGVAFDRSSPAAGRTSSPPTGAPDAPSRPARRGCPRPSTSRTPPPAPPPGASPARAITARRYSGSLEIRTVSSRSPVSVIRTSTDRRRCRSIPTICRPCVLLRSQGPPRVVGREHPEHEPGVTRSGGPAPSSHQRRVLRGPATAANVNVDQAAVLSLTRPGCW